MARACCYWWTYFRFFSGSFVSLPPTIAFTLSPSLSVVGVRSGTLFIPIAFGLLVGNPIAGAVLRRGWASLEAFCGASILVSGGFVIGARIAKAGWTVKARAWDGWGFLLIRQWVWNKTLLKSADIFNVTITLITFMKCMVHREVYVGSGWLLSRRYISVAVASNCQLEKSEKEVEREKRCFLFCYTLLQNLRRRFSNVTSRSYKSLL